MVRVMSIQNEKGASMVFSQFLVPDYWCGWKFNHRDVFISIHGIQMHTDHWDFRAIFIWVALLLTDGARRDLSRFSGTFSILSPDPFWVGRCGCGG